MEIIAETTKAPSSICFCYYSVIESDLKPHTTHKMTLVRMWMRQLTMLTESNHVEVGSPGIIPSLAPSRVFLPYYAPEEKLSVPNTLSQLRCEPATKCGPITTPLQHNTALSTLPHTWKCCKSKHWAVSEATQGLPGATDKGKVWKEIPARTAHIVTILGTANFLHAHWGRRPQSWRMADGRVLDLLHH